MSEYNKNKSTERKKEFLSFVTDARNRADADSQRKVWDGPSKHFVRTNAWLNYIDQYLKKRKNEGEDSIPKYLTLPGKNATDIGLFWQNKLILKTNEKYINVAIVDKEEAANVAINLSNSIGSPLAASGKELHRALADPLLTNLFPFDVINLDFCNFISSMQPESVATAKHNQDSIGKIFDLQKGQSFLLLLTYRAIDDGTSMKDLLSIIDNNIRDETPFRDEYHTVYGTKKADSALKDIKKFNQLAYSKLIAKYAKDHHYRAIEHFCGDYIRKNPKDGLPYFMICHTIELEQIIAPNANTKNKYHPRVLKSPKDEGEEKIKYNIPLSVQREVINSYENGIVSLLRRKPINIDERLKQNPKLKDDCVKASQNLIEWWTKI